MQNDEDVYNFINKPFVSLLPIILDLLLVAFYGYFANTYLRDGVKPSLFYTLRDSTNTHRLIDGSGRIQGKTYVERVVNAWTYAFLPSGSADLRKLVEDFGKAFTSLIGAFHTLVLAAVYIPASYILEERQLVLLSIVIREDNLLENKFKGEGSTSFLQDTFPRVLAVLGPFLAGPASDYIKGLFQL